ncbi:MAG: type II secretion system F family protein [Bdellovibrionaceae bacterium]|nr:type II secretion system F family protein [Pseudobdellovibrionaceae bacterium]
MSLFNNTWILCFTVGSLMTLVFYLNSEKWIQFLTEKSFGVQKEILEIIDKLLISQDTKKLKRNSWIFTISLSLIVFISLWPHVVMSLIASTIVFIGSWWFLKKLFQSLWDRHCNQAVDQMVEALTIVCNSLKVGLRLGQALERVIKNYPGALAKEFSLVLNKMQLGQNLEESLEEMGKRLKKPEIDMLVSTVNILKETGGNLAETFFVMAETIRERQKMEKKIKALTAQGMMQAKIISALPFILIGIFFIMDRNYISPLLFKPLGWISLAIVLVLVLVGGFLMKKMVEIKV